LHLIAKIYLIMFLNITSPVKN